MPPLTTQEDQNTLKEYFNKKFIVPNKQLVIVSNFKY